MNEWGFIGQDIFVGIEKSVTISKFRKKAWLGNRGKASAF